MGGIGWNSYEIRCHDITGKFLQFFAFGNVYPNKFQDIRREILRGRSPTEELLTMWGHQNHTVCELFILLGRMKHYQSMITLKPFVDSKYHSLIHEGEHNLSRLIRNFPERNKNEPCTKDLGIPGHNFQDTDKILNGPASSPINLNNSGLQVKTANGEPQQNDNNAVVSNENNETIQNSNARPNLQVLTVSSTFIYFFNCLLRNILFYLDFSTILT